MRLSWDNRSTLFDPLKRHRTNVFLRYNSVPYGTVHTYDTVPLLYYCEQCFWEAILEEKKAHV